MSNIANSTVERFECKTKTFCRKFGKKIDFEQFKLNAWCLATSRYEKYNFFSTSVLDCVLKENKKKPVDLTTFSFHMFNHQSQQFNAQITWKKFSFNHFPYCTDFCGTNPFYLETRVDR